ncbi:FAD-binding protein [Acinetobacter sp. YIM 103518]|uniref:D-2-hydroxyglutarate dehydrogenase n=1 Tax=Acinetobacter faecalis TaxID=2665161 RepID=A0A6L6GHQ9_9GAMM|nr:FAD-binding and (Fe-S)-binding domain-containing protein [Acinetobacter faecalis]MTD12028.1 FAD-binding protein [Acinetobacter faecalis]
MDMEQRVAQFLDELKTNFSGDIDRSDAARQVYSTDNSIYQQRPQAVIYPKHQQDLQYLMRLVGQTQYREISLTPRGGGTGTNGQSLTHGIMVDVSRYMNLILEIDPINKTALVQAGVVKDQLNAALKPYGLFFAPELSTSNRATIGGMINTDASGQGSCRYGKTHHHVLALDTVLLGGEVLNTQALAKSDWQKELEQKPSFVKNIYQRLFQIADEHQEIITNSFPNLNRSLTGYDLPSFLTQEHLNLNAVLCGSEGTLGIISQAKLNLLEIPKYRMLVNIGYANFQDALKDATALMQHQPLSIETVDSTVLQLAKEDIVWHKVAKYFPEQQEQIIDGINLVEFDAETEDQLKQIEQDFLQHLKQDSHVLRLTHTIAWGSAQISDVYAMRKRAVGLLGNVQGEKRPQPFVEDTAVPPENLADYIADFRALLDGYGLRYGMFGHVDAGVLHVRPALDMKDPNALKMMKDITDAVVKLTHQYGGVLWGEHGKGLRSAYAPVFFGKAYPLLQQVKALFDPYNQLNPGKIATPQTLPNVELTQVDQVATRGSFDRQIAVKQWKEFSNTMHCNGNGACFNYDLDDPMCPSYKITRDRIHSPKGRATLVKEWLRRENTGQSTKQFDQEVYSALHGCLSCKSCVGQCPVKVDIPDAKARFLEQYHQRYPRQLRDHALGNLEKLLPKIVKIAPIYNAVQAILPLQKIQNKLAKMVDVPLFHPMAQKRLSDYGAYVIKEDLSNLNAIDSDAVFIVQDAFTRYFDTPILIDLIKLVRKLGKKPYIVPYFANGKPLHVHGFIAQFEILRRNNIELLNQIASYGYPLVGVDPAMTLVFRQEYQMHYQQDVPQVNYQVLLVQEWLQQLDLKSLKVNQLGSNHSYYLAAHCTERTQLPKTNIAWQEIYRDLGLKLEILPLGCCGMAGTYGHEQEHSNLSKQIFTQSWQPQVERYQQQILATGYSCRTQVKRLSKTELKHPLQVLLENL